MTTLGDLFESNRRWARRVQRESPGFFAELQSVHKPRCFLIGCSDARVPASQILGLPPGEVFVHRNVANQVIQGDLNCLAALQYAVDALKVPDVIVCGHYGCGGVHEACSDEPHGLVDHWLVHIRDMIDRNREELVAIADPEARERRVCELNAVEQVRGLCHTPSVQQAWARGQALAVHGWMFSLADGLLRDLEVTVRGPSEIPEVFPSA